MSSSSSSNNPKPKRAKKTNYKKAIIELQQLCPAETQHGAASANMLSSVSRNNNPNPRREQQTNYKKAILAIKQVDSATTQRRVASAFQAQFSQTCLLTQQIPWNMWNPHIIQNQQSVAMPPLFTSTPPPPSNHAQLQTAIQSNDQMHPRQVRLEEHNITLRDNEVCRWSYCPKSKIVNLELLKTPMKGDENCRLITCLMEIDDIVLITSYGIKRTKPLLDFIKVQMQRDYRNHHSFKMFDLSEDGKFVESSQMISMPVTRYYEYLLKVEELAKEETEQSSSTCQARFSFATSDGLQKEIDLRKTIVVSLSILNKSCFFMSNDIIWICTNFKYCLDYEVSSRFPEMLDKIKEVIGFSGVLPGEYCCLLQNVPDNLRPDNGPHAYITPAGAFTRFHRDGNGTVDSGHLCLEGCNEVIMLRPSLSAHETKSLFKILKGKKFDEQPHSLGGSFDWPTHEMIEQLEREG